MIIPAALLLLSAFGIHASAQRPATALTDHIRGASDLGELRDMQADWNNGVLTLSTDKAERHAWAVLPAPQGGWDLSRRATMNAEITNTGVNPIAIMLWVVGDHGWEAVADCSTLAPRESRNFSCDLRATFPDKTPKLNPNEVKQVHIMLAEPVSSAMKAGEKDVSKTRLNPRITKPVSLEVRAITAQGDTPRLDAPGRSYRCSQRRRFPSPGWKASSLQDPR